MRDLSHRIIGEASPIDDSHFGGDGLSRTVASCPLPSFFDVVLDINSVGMSFMKLPSASSLGLRGVAVVWGLLPALGVASDFTYRLGPVDNAFVRNPAPATSVQYGTAMAAGDFNNDNVRDLAIAAYGSSEVRILFGKEWDVGAAPASKFVESSISLPFPLFSPKLATGDFDHDGDDELAIGNQDFSDTASNAGRVLVMRYNGLTWATQEIIEQGTSDYSGVAEPGDWLGSSLAVGDFDNDGYDDLAIGAKGEDVGSVNEAGAVLIAYGSSVGITGARDQLVTRNNDGLTVAPATVERYGTALASGDFNDDGYDDLAIGATRARCPNGTDSAGAVVMMLGSASGIVNTGTRQFRPGVLGVLGSCTDNQVFGRTLASGNFDSDSNADLAIATGENAVHILYGETTIGLQTAGDQRITPASLPGGSDGDFRFGEAMATGRFNAIPFDIFPGRVSLAIGASFDTVNGVLKAGSVSVIPGSGSGLLPAEAMRFTRSSSLESGPPVAVDLFGAALAAGDFNDDGTRDLAIGVPYFDDGTLGDRGAVQVLYNSEFIFRNGLQ
ncbi:MAG: FG-GAP repeat protein [Tahibacter sp.]